MRKIYYCYKTFDKSRTYYRILDKTIKVFVNLSQIYAESKDFDDFVSWLNESILCETICSITRDESNDRFNDELGLCKNVYKIHGNIQTKYQCVIQYINKNILSLMDNIRKA